jgi:putative hydrolase of the HAD superfamily
MALRAIIFDLDDTLYPEHAYVRSGFEAVAAWASANLGIAVDDGFAELTSLFEQGVRGNTFDIWLRDHAIRRDSHVPKLIQIYRDHRPTIQAFPGTIELLEELSHDYALGLLTDGFGPTQQQKVAALGLAPYLKEQLYTHALGNGGGKPSSRPYRLILGGLGVEGREAIYVGDNPMKDFIGARRERMGTVRVRTPQGIYRDVEPPSFDHAPDREIEDLQHLPDVLPDFAAAGPSNQPERHV